MTNQIKLLEVYAGCGILKKSIPEQEWKRN